MEIIGTDVFVFDLVGFALLLAAVLVIGFGLGLLWGDYERRSLDEAELEEEERDDDLGVDWEEYANDYLSGDPERLLSRLPEHLRPYDHEEKGL